MIDASKSISKKVLGLTAIVDTQIPLSGEIVRITEFKYQANPNQDTHVRLVWDYLGLSEEILAIGYGTGTTPICIEVVGDGTKILAIVVQNDSGGAEYLGGGYTALKS